LPWLAANVPFAERTARSYMRMARDPRTLEFAHLGVASVLDAITEHRPKSANPVADLPAGEAFDGGGPLSDEVVQDICDAMSRANQQLAADPDARDFAYLGIVGVLRIAHDKDPQMAALLGDDLVARIKAWNSAEFKRGMQRLRDAPFVMALAGREWALEQAKTTSTRKLAGVAIMAMGAARMPQGRIERCLHTESHRELEIALVDALSKLGEERPDDCRAAYQRWEAGA
jgi:hypothetical protein